MASFQEAKERETLNDELRGIGPSSFPGRSQSVPLPY